MPTLERARGRVEKPALARNLSAFRTNAEEGEGKGRFASPLTLHQVLWEAGLQRRGEDETACSRGSSEGGAVGATVAYQ